MSGNLLAGVWVTLDGEPTDGPTIPLHDDRQEHTVEVRLTKQDK